MSLSKLALLQDTSPFPLVMRVYIFGVRNPSDILAGENVHLVEHGPYSYWVERWKINVSTEAEDEEYVSFGQVRI